MTNDYQIGLDIADLKNKVKDLEEKYRVLETVLREFITEKEEKNDKTDSIPQ